VKCALHKRTSAYKDYLQYLADFDTKHGGSVAESKRPKLEQEPSDGSVLMKSIEAPAAIAIAPPL
jgi:hypothetical protein